MLAGRESLGQTNHLEVNTAAEGRIRGKGRLPELDVYRGIALVLMVLIHNMFTWTPIGLRQWPGPWQVADLYFGMSASLFFAASGAAAFVSLTRRRDTEIESNGLVQHVGSRALLLYAIGTAFEQIWHAPPYDVTFFAELNTIAVIGLLALLFVLRDWGVRTLTIIGVAMASAFFLIRYVFSLESIAYGVYVITPFWRAPTIRFAATFPLAKLAIEFGYSFSAFGTFGVFGVVLARFLVARKVGPGLLGVGAALMLSGYLVQAVFVDPLKKWPMSMSYFLLAAGFTILVFFLAKAIARVPGAAAGVISAPLAAAGRYALPVYFGHYLMIFFAEATGVAVSVRETSSGLAGVLAVTILVTVTLAILAAAWIAARFRLSIPTPRKAIEGSLRTYAALLVASGVVSYVVILGSLLVPAGQNLLTALFFFAVGASITSLWYVAYRLIA